jgi:hypothetical protein
VTADDVVPDGGRESIGGRGSVGVPVDGATNVTIRHLDVTRRRVGVQVRDARDVTLGTVTTRTNVAGVVVDDGTGVTADGIDAPCGRVGVPASGFDLSVRP